MKCNFIKENGKQCQANAMSESDYCYLHNPEIAEEVKRLNQIRGGENRAVVLKEALPPMEIHTPDDTISLLADTIGRVRAGEMDIKVANCIGVLSGHLLKAFEVARLNDKVELIERVVLEKRKYR